MWSRTYRERVPFQEALPVADVVMSPPMQELAVDDALLFPKSEPRLESGERAEMQSFPKTKRSSYRKRKFKVIARDDNEGKSPTKKRKKDNVVTPVHKMSRRNRGGAEIQMFVHVVC